MEYIPFRPALQGGFATRFYQQVQKLIPLQNADRKITQEIDNFIDSEVSWAVNDILVNPQQRRIYRAVWLLLRDLLHVRWYLIWYEETLRLIPPGYRDQVSTVEEMQTEKESVRFAMARSRELRIATAEDFIRRVEAPTEKSLAFLPMTELIADGKKLAQQLQGVTRLDKAEDQMEALREVIKPYLQLVSEDRCNHSGHKLTDIWRYFRYTWAVPAESTPGRTLHYLIRDAARPNHPIMGIASLENAVIRSPDRDHELGWSTRTVGKQLLQADAKQARAIFTRLLEDIDRSLTEVKWDDLCETNEIKRPSIAVIKRISNIALESSSERKVALDEWRSDQTADGATVERSELGNISLTAETALYRAKRATRVYRLLQAKYRLQQIVDDDNFGSNWRITFGYIAEDGTIADEEIRSAIRTVIRAVKSRHVGTSILELNVCGAVPPYNAILGGKLVALMVLSPEVVSDYRKRYGRRASDIASKMKGEPVVRPAEIVFIGTTSLYRVGASQYNRLKLPNGLLRDDAPEVRWKRLGETAGYGTMHISADTLRALDEATLIDGGTYINSVFGEGASPKLRALRHALSVVLDLEPSQSSVELTQHTMSRLIFGAWLATNGKAFLRDRTEKPIYYFDEGADPKEQTQKIVEYWRKRWLLKRIHFAPAIQQIRSFKVEDIALGTELDEQERSPFITIRDEVAVMEESDKQGQHGWSEFVRNLYRGTSAYADQMDNQLLEMLHVKTDLDQAVVDMLATGRSVVLTGNPGDGKTHLLRILQPELLQLSTQPVLEYDASAKTDDDLLAEWQQALTEGRPFCVAINEAVLINLAKRTDYGVYDRALNQVRSAQEQVLQAVFYGQDGEDISVDELDVVVFDLSRRNILSQRVVSRVIETLADPDKLYPCATDGSDDLSLNARLLRNQKVQDRLQAVLDRVSQKGYHATVRELQSLISYLLFADRVCEQILRHSGDLDTSLPQLPYKGKGALFRELQEVFDPARITHPIWDDLLVSGQTDDSEWLTDWNEVYAQTMAIPAEDFDKFTFRKRAFFFFHDKGDELLSILGSTDNGFTALLHNASDTAQNRTILQELITMLNAFFGHEGRELHVWQSHRYDQSSRRILYSSNSRRRQEFEVVVPKLISTMAKGFDLAVDHVVLRLRDKPTVRLKIDYYMFELLTQAKKGLPVISMDNNLTRRIWQFMELLVDPNASKQDEVTIKLYDLTTGERISVNLDTERRQYLEISEGI